MKLDSLIKKCLIDDDAIATKPFQKEEYEGLTVMRHKSNEKWFALIFENENGLFINLKAPPDLISILKDQYPSITAAWHMNKKHWCTVDVNNTPESTLKELIKVSFDITAPKKKR